MYEHGYNKCECFYQSCESHGPCVKLFMSKGGAKFLKTVLSFRKSLMRPTCICFWENLNVFHEALCSYCEIRGTLGSWFEANIALLKNR